MRGALLSTPFLLLGNNMPFNPDKSRGRGSVIAPVLELRHRVAIDETNRDEDEIFDPDYNSDYFDLDQVDEYADVENEDDRHDHSIDFEEEEDEYESFLNRNDKCSENFDIENFARDDE